MKCSVRPLLFILSSLGFTFSLMHPAYGYILMRSSSSGAETHWGAGSQLTYRMNTTNTSGLSASDLFAVFTTSLSRWQQAAHNGFSYVFYNGTDPSIYPNYLGSPYDNSIFFTSNASDSSDQLQCGIIGLTEVWYDPGSGSISKADLRFNDQCYRFTLTPSDTRSQENIYMGDVATHELGHSLGLDHSQNAQSSMIYTADLEMSHPSCDDEVAMVHLYATDVQGSAGTLTGHVLSPTGAAVFGAHVEAIELERGVALSSAISDKDGSFTINGLEPARYTVMVEPYFPGQNALSAYYQGISSAVCSGQNFSRTFPTSNGQLLSNAVPAGGTASLGNVTVNCEAPTSANSFAETDPNSAPVLAANELSAPVSSESAFTTSNTHYYRLNQQSGHIVATALTYTLFSPADLQVALLDTNGNALPGSSASNAFSSSTSGYINYDAVATADIDSPTDIFVRITDIGTLPTTVFPSASVGVDATPFYALSVSSGAPAAALFPANSRCENADTFAAYQSPGAAPPFQTQGSSSSAGCGTIEDGDHDPMSPGGTARLANFAGMALVLALAHRRLRGKSVRFPSV